jgi:nicotinate-nucleotide--dimethylbenzimidazole phosphoribosyltransferase
MTRLARAIDAIATLGGLDAVAMSLAQARLDSLTKPPGSLGRIERIAVTLAGITGDPAPRVRPRCAIVVASDHGVAAQGVSAYPQNVTAEMVRNFLAGGAAVSVLARSAAVDVVVVDAGLASGPIQPLSAGSARLITTAFRGASDDISTGPAMTRDEAVRAIECGMDVAAEAIGAGARLVAVGEMGIGNTTPASAIVAVLLRRDPADVTGRGTGLDTDRLAHKIDVVRAAIAVNQPNPDDAIGVLAALGGRDIAVLVGVTLEAAASRIPLLLDGFITAAAALVACAVCRPLAARLIASHRSAERGHRLVLDALGLEPLLDLELRLGEASGALLALPLIDAACAIRDEMATFESAGVSGAEKGVHA